MQRMLTVILAFLGMVGALAIDTYLPSIPAIGREFSVGPLAVQQTLSIFLFSFAFMMLFYGTLSDSFGRRPVLLVLCGLSALLPITMFSLMARGSPVFALGGAIVLAMVAGGVSAVGAVATAEQFGGQARLTGLALGHMLSAEWLLVLGGGLLGGYTTFSTASVETVRLLQQRRYLPALAVGLGMLVASVAAAGLGLWLGLSV